MCGSPASWFFLATLLVGSGDAEEKVVVPENLRLELPWQTGPYCGPNCLYFFLRYHGVDVTHEGLIASFGKLEAGTSLWELKTAAEEYGVAADVVQADERALKKLAIPFIAHFNVPAGEGHFVLVLAVSDTDGVEYVGGSHMETVTTPLAPFVRSWSGYALVPISSPWGGSAARAWVLRGLWFAVGLAGIAIVGLKRYGPALRVASFR